jgi:hypothetical protein
MAATLDPKIRVHIYRLDVGPPPHIRHNPPDPHSSKNPITGVLSNNIIWNYLSRIVVRQLDRRHKLCRGQDIKNSQGSRDLQKSNKYVTHLI